MTAPSERGEGMSIMTCDKHGNWDSDKWVDGCPRCSLDNGEMPGLNMTAKPAGDTPQVDVYTTEQIRKLQASNRWKWVAEEDYRDSERALSASRAEVESMKRDWDYVVAQGNTWRERAEKLRADLAAARALPFVVEYRGKNGYTAPLNWTAMAAFDSERIAIRYAEDCKSEHWEYQMAPHAPAVEAAKDSTG